MKRTSAMRAGAMKAGSKAASLRTGVLLTVLAAGLLAAAPAGAVDLFFDPEVTYADPGETFTVSVEVADLDSLRGYEIEVEFDNDLIDFLSADRGELFAGYAPPYGLYWSVEDQDSLVRVECLIIPEDQCVAGPGEILRLTFEALEGPGESPLHISDATVRDCGGAPIEPVQTFDGTVVVGPVATLFFNPDPKYVLGAGHPCRISMEVDSVDSLRGFQVYLEYDNTKIDFDSALIGDLLLPTPPVPLWWYVLEESPTLVRVEGVILGPGLFVNGPGELIKLHFTGLVDFDSTWVVFSEWHVWDVNTDEFYPVAVDDGLIILDAALQEVPEDLPPGNGPWLVLRPAKGSPGSAPSFLCEAGSAAPLRAVLYDVAGRTVHKITPQTLGSSSYRLAWDGRDESGRLAPPGIYLLKVSAGGRAATAKCVLVR